MDKILKVNYERHTLSNGLEILLYPRKQLPVTAVNLWYKVGSANEVPGKTGFAHLFEHMMFQGSQNVDKEKHFHFIQEAGGSLNGSTSIDRTNYYETVPSNYLEMVFWLESDRMGYLLPALTQEKLDNQKSVVMNERRERYDNQPYGRAFETIFSNLFPEKHPYHWPTIGWMKDIEGFELDDVKDFFRKYYAPNNATMVVGGNFDKNETLELAEKYFGEIESNVVPNGITVPEVKLTENKEMLLEDNVQLSRIYLAWNSCKAYSDDDAALDILADQLGSGKNSRLYKKLVYDNHKALEVSAFQYPGKYDGSFFIIATAYPGVSLDELKKEIFNELNLMVREGISEEELTRSKNSIKSTFIFSLQNLDTLVDHINTYNFYLNEPDSFIYDLGRYNNLTTEAVRAACDKYLRNPYVELKVVPKGGNDAN